MGTLLFAFWILLNTESAQTKRVMLPLPPQAALPAAELKHLGQRVGKELRSCPGMSQGAGGNLEVLDRTGQGLDMAILKGAIGEELSIAEGASGPIVEIHADLSYREWKRGVYSSTYTLNALVKRGGKKICEKTHRTVQKREKK